MLSESAPLPEIDQYLERVTVEDLENDPYAVYARMRAEAPVAYVPSVGNWFATLWKDVEYIGNHPELFTADFDAPLRRSFGDPTILTEDGPPHADIRTSLDSKYKAKAVRGYIDELVDPIVEERLASLKGKSDVDILAEYFEPISVVSFARVLGLGHLDAETMRRWFRGLAQGAINHERDPQRQAINDATAAEIDLEMGPVFDRLEKEPDDSTISHMLHSGMPEGETRERDYILPTIKVIILGGMQEPGHGAASTTYALLSNRDQLERVIADPETMVPRAVEEGLRWVSPIGTQTRKVTQAVEFGGVTVPAGAIITASLSSANRDESMYDEDPSVFNIDRTRRAHVAFGFGEHFCAGNMFARGVARIAIAGLLRQFPDVRLDTSEQTSFVGWVFRAPRSLRVHL
jgi:cytochrome P450